MKFDNMLWFKSMRKYSMKGVNNVEQLSKDVDLELIPKIIEKIVLDKIDRKYMLQFIFSISNFYFLVFFLEMVTSQWDPMSLKQTKRISSVIKSILDSYPTIDPDSKLLMSLLTNLVDRIRDTVANDVFIPISSRQ